MVREFASVRIASWFAISLRKLAIFFIFLIISDPKLASLVASFDLDLLFDLDKCVK